MLELTPPEATHRLILQDDAQPCQDFLAAATAALEAQPESLVVFFVPGSSYHESLIYEACHRGDAWARLPNHMYCPAVAVAYPARLIAPFLAFVDRQHWPPAFTADDAIICRFLEASAEWALATVPSLVEHPDLHPSIGRPPNRYRVNDPARHAACFVHDSAVSPLEIDWTLGP